MILIQELKFIKKYTKEEITYARVIKYKKKKNLIYLSHYQTMTGNMDDSIGKTTLNFHGHTHQTTNFTEGQGFYMYHVGVDSHDCYPVHIDDALEAIKKVIKEENKNEI